MKPGCIVRRGRLSAIVVALAGASAAAAAGGPEPTAAEIRSVIQARFDRIAGTMNGMQQQCRRGAGRSNPGDAMMCLGVTMGNAGGAGQPMTITRFEKLGCAPASGKAGWVCDDIVGISGGSTGAMGSMMGQMLGRGSVSQARFLRSTDGWVAIFNEKN